jgi:hypothetical protein
MFEQLLRRPRGSGVHDVVVLTRDLPEEGPIAGDVGAVVGRYAAGGYEGRRRQHDCRCHISRGRYTATTAA